MWCGSILVLVNNKLCSFEKCFFMWLKIDDDVFVCLVFCVWLGNDFEFYSVIENFVLSSDNGCICVSDLLEYLFIEQVIDDVSVICFFISLLFVEVEKEVIINVVQVIGGCIQEMLVLFGIGCIMLWWKMK